MRGNYTELHGRCPVSGVCRFGIGGCLHSLSEGELSFTPGLGKCVVV